MIRVFEAFAGIGTQRMALKNIGVEHEVVGISEIDKFALKSYMAIHGETKNFGDITKIKTKELPDFDLFTYSFPCQDISVAGKQKGLDEESGTRSSLLWECERIIKDKRPKYLLMENVKNLVGKRHKENFEKWLEVLEKLGYTNYHEILNAKDYGIPQNRERVFCISILEEHEPYEFPEKQELQLRLKDMLEDEVDEKFYLSEEQTKRLSGNSFNQANVRIQDKNYSDTLLARDYKDPKCVRVGGIFDKDGKTRQAGGIWDKEQLAPTLDTMQGGWRQPSVMIKNGTKKGYIEAKDGDGIDLAFPESKTRRGRVQKEISQTLDTGDAKGVLIGASRGRNPKNPSDRTVGVKTEQRLEINKQGTSNTITTVQKDNYVIEPNVLTPKRTEYGKAIRKEYESGLINESRHNMTEMKPRTDGISNTLTTVQKDNYVLESNNRPKLVGGIGEINFGNQYRQGNRIYDSEAIAMCLNAQPVGNAGGHSYLYKTDFRIRKLTPLECWRLMGCTDEDFFKAQEVNSNTQLYKQAGNAIVVDVLEGIFEKLYMKKECKSGSYK